MEKNPYYFIKYIVWSWCKVRLLSWWWAVRYGGRKNIPKEMIMGQLQKSMARMNQNLGEALRHIPENLTEMERKEFLDVLREAATLEKEIEKQE